MKKRITKCGFVFILILFIGLNTNAFSENNGADSTLCEIIDSALINNITPGIQYVVIDKDSIIFKYSAGYSDIKNNYPMTFDNTINAFSVTKLITAIAVLQLYESGRIGLDDLVSEYIPDIRYPDFTIRELLTHSSGLPDPVLGNFFIHWESEHDTFNRDSLMNRFLLKHSKLKFIPGSKINYSSLGFALLGKIIEVVTDQPYEEYIQQSIFDKLSIADSLCNFNCQHYPESAKPYYRGKKADYNFIAHLVKGSVVKKEGIWKTIDRSWYMDFPSHGGLITSADIFAGIFQDLISDDPVLLNKETIKLFFTEQKDYRERRVAISWFIYKEGEEMYYAHRGGGIGYAAEIRFYPYYGIFTVMFMNSTDPKGLGLLNRLDNEIISEIKAKV